MVLQDIWDMGAPFWAWFQDSKVVGMRGNPLVVYHGSTSDFDIFDFRRAKAIGMHFGTKRAAKQAAENCPVDFSYDWRPYASKVVRTYLLQLGFDGIVYDNACEDEGSTSWIAFRPEQIKSVNNWGTFGPQSPDVRRNPAGSNQMHRQVWVRKDHLIREDGTSKNITLGTRVECICRTVNRYIGATMQRRETGVVIASGKALEYAAKRATGTTAAMLVQVD